MNVVPTMIVVPQLRRRHLNVRDLKNFMKDAVIRVYSGVRREQAAIPAG